MLTQAERQQIRKEADGFLANSVRDAFQKRRKLTSEERVMVASEVINEVITFAELILGVSENDHESRGGETVTSEEIRLKAQEILLREMERLESNAEAETAPLHLAKAEAEAMATLAEAISALSDI